MILRPPLPGQALSLGLAEAEVVGAEVLGLTAPWGQIRQAAMPTPTALWRRRWPGPDRRECQPPGGSRDRGPRRPPQRSWAPPGPAGPPRHLPERWPGPPADGQGRRFHSGTRRCRSAAAGRPWRRPESRPGGSGARPWPPGWDTPTQGFSAPRPVPWRRRCRH